MKFALDTNCFIDAVSPDAHAYLAMQRILRAGVKKEIELYVSLQTLDELEQKRDAALIFARTVERLPHYSIGSWDDQVGSWADEAGTWADGRQDDERQKHFESIANAGTDIRDRGAFIDALRAKCDAYVTSDRQMVSPGPAARIAAEFGIEVIAPQALAERLPAMLE